MSSDEAAKDRPSLDSVRETLIRLEDSIVFCLIERAKHPRNAPAYGPPFLSAGRSIADLYFRESEALLAKIGHYQRPEHVPFFPGDLPSPVVPKHSSSPQVLPLPAASVSVNDEIWKVYFDELLPLFTEEGDDGDYATSVSCDLACMQALSKRIHCGKYVAEAKYADAPEEYSALIDAEDSDGLMKLLTFPAVEDAVKRRVEKKARVFGQNVTCCDGSDRNGGGAAAAAAARYKVDPSFVSGLYEDWVMPLTKDVEVKYLLLRLS